MGDYPRSEKILLEDSTISNSTIFSDSYHEGIYLKNCEITETKGMIGCCGASINVDESIVTESVFVDIYYNFASWSHFFFTIL